MRHMLNCAEGQGGGSRGVTTGGGEERAHTGGTKRRRCTISQLSARGSATPDSLVSQQKAAELPPCAGDAYRGARPVPPPRPSARTLTRAMCTAPPASSTLHVHQRSARWGGILAFLPTDRPSFRRSAHVIVGVRGASLPLFLLRGPGTIVRAKKPPPLALPQRNSRGGAIKSNDDS